MSKTILKAPLFEVIEEELEYPDGKHKKLTVIRKPTVSVFPLLPDNTICLISEYRPMYGRRIMEACAGFIEIGEDIKKAAQRELLEETGIIAKKWDKLTTLNLTGGVMKTEAHLFLARDLEFGEQHLESNEDIKLVKMPLSEAVEKVFRGEITIATSTTGILMIDRMRQRGEI